VRENTDDDRTTKEAYCSNCETEREVRITVPWQEDLCLHCGNAVE